jgi:hypothetical protein
MMEEHGRMSLLARIILWLRGLFQSVDADDDDQNGRRPDPSNEHHSGVITAQIGIIRAAFGDELGVACEVPGDDTTATYLYRAGHVLVPTDQVAALQRVFESHSDLYGEVSVPSDEPSEGLTLFRLPGRLDNVDQPDEATLAHIDAALGPGVVTPDHLVFVTLYARMCPADEPDSPGRERPWPRETRDTDRGADVRIDVVDTGWWKQAAQDPDAPYLANGVDGDAEQINPAAIHPYGGHGTFVAGVVRCQAPAAEVTIHGMLTKGGAIFESELMKQLDIAVFQDAPDIVSISGGTHTYNDQPLKTFEHLAEKHNLIDNPDAPLIVAAAGNDRTDQKFWPAAFDWVVGVGSLDRDDTVSDYSDYGDWVDIYALGRDHVNAFPTGTYTCYEPPNVGQVRQFQNLAKWSGTSFSTPLISGLLAGIMSEHGLTAHEAWLRMKADAIVRTDPNVGKILTVDTPGD